MSSKQYQFSLSYEPETSSIILYLTMEDLEDMVDFGSADDELTLKIPLDKIYDLIGRQ